MKDFMVATPDGFISLTVDFRRPLFIVGRNGTGKSALVHHIQKNNHDSVTYLPGSRSAVFDGEGVNLTSVGRKQLVANLHQWDQQSDARWKSGYGNQRNDRAIHDLTLAESQYKSDWANKIANNLDTDAAVDKLQSKVSPLDKVNLIFEQSNISVRMILSDGELKACAGNNIFSFARLSDGERIALILIAEIIAAKPGIIFIIDEPELHLHRSIVVPLIKSLINTRPDCQFLISTHELDLPAAVDGSRVCIVRSVKWIEGGQIENWSIDMIDSSKDLPEDLTTDILGSRQRVLFTEGTPTSLDVPMYSVLFPKVSVRPKGSCKDVLHAVSGIRSTLSFHRTEGYGLIDNDGMSSTEIAEMESNGIFALPFYSVESIYYDEIVVGAVAQRQASTFSISEEDRELTAKRFVSDSIQTALIAAKKIGIAEQLAARIAERKIRDSLFSQIPKRDEIISLSSTEIQLSTHSRYPAELARFNTMLATNNIFGIISRYPVRHSGILTAIAKALRFPGRSEYEAAAIARIGSDMNLRGQLLSKLAPLDSILNA